MRGWTHRTAPRSPCCWPLGYITGDENQYPWSWMLTFSAFHGHTCLENHSITSHFYGISTFKSDSSSHYSRLKAWRQARGLLFGHCAWFDAIIVVSLSSSLCAAWGPLGHSLWFFLLTHCYLFNCRWDHVDLFIFMGHLLLWKSLVRNSESDLVKLDQDWASACPLARRRPGISLKRRSFSVNPGIRQSTKEKIQ